MSEYRLIRLGRQIQEEIGSMIVEGRIKDYRVGSALSITRVEVARDLAYADVFVSSYEAADRLELGVTGLTSAAPFIQGKLGAKMHIRQTPKLRFHVDSAMSEGFDLVKRIEDLNA